MKNSSVPITGPLFERQKQVLNIALNQRTSIQFITYDDALKQKMLLEQIERLKSMVED